MSQSTNFDKNKRGRSLQNTLEELVTLCKDLEYIQCYEKDYKIGAPNYANATQFRAPYLLSLDDSTQWAIFTTTSLRDRIKEQQWDSFFLKEINKSITRAFLVYPDGLSKADRNAFVSKNKKIENKYEVSALDGLISQEDFFNKVEAVALSSLTPAQMRDKRGKHFEKRVAAVLNNSNNWEKWIYQDPMLEGLHFHLFEKLAALLQLDRSKLQYIEAFADPAIIGTLPSGGAVKTDVLATVVNKDGSSRTCTISCKRSSAATVSVHQYSADAFADVLDPTNQELRRVLHEFQRCGNVRDMLESDRELLTQQIKPHILKLCMWALGGVNGEGDPETQWAKYLVIYDDVNDYQMHTVEGYAKLLMDNDRERRTFGTPFSWTYQGQRGTNIQLKCPIKI